MTRSRAIRHGLRAVAAAGVVAAAVLAPVAPFAAPAGARMQEAFLVREGQVTTQTYPPIPNAYPRAFVEEDAPVLTPADCTTPPTDRMCDTVPFEVIPADLPEFEDWFVEITLSFPHYQTGLQLDMYVWDNQQIAKRDDASSTTYTQLAAAATASNPEVITVLKPMLGRYNLTVSNWLGDNKGYTVTAKIKYGDPFQRPDELLEEANSGKPSESLEDFGTPPIDFSDLGELDSADAIFDATLAAIDVVGDRDLDASGLNELGNLPMAPVMPSDLLSNEPPGPASGVLLLISLVLVPALVAGGGVAGVLRYTNRNRMGFV